MATLKGKWRFNETLVIPAADIEQVVNFATSGRLDGDDGVLYTTLNCTSMLVKVDRATPLQYEVDSAIPEWEYRPAYHPVYSNGVLGLYEFYDEGLRTIYFGETEQEVSDEFYAWFTANAVLLHAATITYGDETIAVIDGGQTATLECAGMMMTANVVVRAEAVSGVGGAAVAEYDNTVEVV